MREITLTGAKYITSENSAKNIQPFSLAESFPSLETFAFGHAKPSMLSATAYLLSPVFPNSLTKLKIGGPILLLNSVTLENLPPNLQYLTLPLAKMNPDEQNRRPASGHGALDTQTCWLSRLTQLHTLQLPKLKEMNSYQLSCLPSSLTHLDLKQLDSSNRDEFLRSLPRGIIRLRIAKLPFVPIQTTDWPPQLTDISIRSIFGAQPSSEDFLRSLPTSLTILKLKSWQNWHAPTIEALPRGLTSFRIKFPDSCIEDFANLKPEAIRGFPPNLKHLRYLSPPTMGGLFDDDWIMPQERLNEASRNGWLPKSLETVAFQSGLEMNEVHFPNPFGNTWTTLEDALRTDDADLFQVLWDRLPTRMMYSPRSMSYRATRTCSVNCAKLMASRGVAFALTERERQHPKHMGAHFRGTASRNLLDHLHVAAAYGSCGMLKWISSEYRGHGDCHTVSLDRKDAFGFNIAHYAAGHRWSPVLDWIKSQGPAGEALLWEKSTGYFGTGAARSLTGFRPCDSAIAISSLSCVAWFRKHYPEHFSEDDTETQIEELISTLSRSSPSTADLVRALSHNLAIGIWYRLDDSSTNLSGIAKRVARAVLTEPEVPYNEGLMHLLCEMGIPFNDPELEAETKDSNRLDWIPAIHRKVVTTTNQDGAQ
jgi:hypothetical protein